MKLSWKNELPQDLQAKVAAVERQIAPRIAEIDEQVTYNQMRVLECFRKHHVAEEDFAGSTGYGYDDVGRDKLDAIYADYFHTEDAMVRPQLISGTHAIATALFSILRAQDTLFYMTGMPYDTIQHVIGIVGDEPGTMLDYGINFDYAKLLKTGKVDYKTVAAKLQKNDSIKVVAIQRSRGYALRDSFTVAEIKEMIAFVRARLPHAIIFIDNCYGEFSEIHEPTEDGADLMAGSLYKNAGAGIVKTGAYLVGRKALIKKAGNRLNVPGAGKHEGATIGHIRDMYQGFFLGPHVTGEAIKGAIFTSALLEKIGLTVSPRWDAPRTDLVQTVNFGDPTAMIGFCQAIQHYSPVNSYVDPVPSVMDGYEDPEIMASGSFTEGSTIELSSDGPMRPPYTLYIQGGLTYSHVKVAISKAVAEIFYEKKDM
ncbi:aminotransferase class I/II-fold pyridoxal phosphate-dependent enzyme [Liquorilactobacillus satsumensis]|uniref:Aluminum resistance protein n=1 Tax=Liquorilactobacillus satsumensis DSM 16230 = JCM 12392 TaxID=1423801 RepID=A0A0R1V8D2_9LACO|nr:methionine gamma-lyase family protein [Liquorilactobacillus satsumensis]KRL99875.1 aluminum resistance protein [Liquorilactobacillus satsumensis DSM 16230 = JCM 12392]MCC7665634.1 aluminum resistance protein [Liquorilactobacillus satsumensis]MCP9328354.1 methionine gamma-lyase family protein [Liquorilactobacillus satsumensis]MCP9358019.1 methionine gamma-lyase family protein [Liquorilactobacillus satsumensis]MCP9371836.1 methionine gamma-lyase family protein [Liquorilactobacillus satsumensi